MKLLVTQRQLGRPVPTKTKAGKQLAEKNRHTKVRFFNQYLEEAQALGLAVAASEWPQRIENTGVCGVDQFICTWDEVADRYNQLLQLLERAADPARPDPTKDSDALSS